MFLGVTTIRSCAQIDNSVTCRELTGKVKENAPNKEASFGAVIGYRKPRRTVGPNAGVLRYLEHCHQVEQN